MAALDFREWERRLGLPRRLPGVVLVAGLLVSAAAGLQVARVAEAKDRERFENAVSQAHLDIEARLAAYTTALRAAAGLFAAQRNEVTREEFRAFAERLDLPRVYPGIQGLGYSARLGDPSSPDVRARLARMGIPGLDIRPATPRAEAHAIVFLEPMDRRNRAAVGYDMFSHPVRRAAMERARDTGRGAASGKVELVQEIDQQKQAGFLIYHPVYQGGRVPPTLAERRARLTGFVYAPFRADDLLRGIFADHPNPRVRIAIYDQSPAPQNLLHKSFPEPLDAVAGDARLTTLKTLDPGGRRWVVAYYSTPEFEAGSSRGLAATFVLGGVLATLLVSAATLWQVRARLEAEAEIQARRAAEHQRQLLVAELNHRVKNTLATVQSIAAQALREGRSISEAREAFEDRLMALGQTHELLTREGWRGADLADVVRLELAPYGGTPGGRVAVEGAPVLLPPEIALAVGMALHELATNAAKYGALSVPGGRVAVSWSVSGEREGRRLRLDWRETGGPPVTAPARRGFGTRLIVTGLSRQLQGEVELSFDPGGVRCRLDAPLPEQPSRVLDATPAEAGPFPDAPQTREAAE